MTARLAAIHSALSHDRPAFKVYDHGADWQLVGHQYERWYSVWTHNKQASLDHALSQIPNYSPDNIVYLWEKSC